MLTRKVCFSLPAGSVVLAQSRPLFPDPASIESNLGWMCWLVPIMMMMMMMMMMNMMIKIMMLSLSVDHDDGESINVMMMMMMILSSYLLMSLGKY